MPLLSLRLGSGTRAAGEIRNQAPPEAVSCKEGSAAGHSACTSALRLLHPRKLPAHECSRPPWAAQGRSHGPDMLPGPGDQPAFGRSSSCKAALLSALPGGVWGTDDNEVGSEEGDLRLVLTVHINEILMRKPLPLAGRSLCDVLGP